MLTNARAGGVVQGGSSITQQLAKNLFLSNERTIERKVKEAFLAIWLEARLTKNEILKLYLDRAYLGGGTFGVDAAAQYYFNKSARDVNLAEAAMLAGLFKAPSRFAPHINLPAARARANVVLDNLVEAGFMTEGQVFGARRNPAIAVDRRDERSPNYYLDWAFDEMKKLVDTLPEVGARARLRRAARARRRSAAATRSRRSRTRCASTAANTTPSRRAAVLMDIDGAVRAMVGGRDYGESQFNRATDALRQPGSSFKPYVYAAALHERLQADLDRGRLAGLHRQLVPEELLRRLFRLDDADAGADALDQHHPGASSRSRSATAIRKSAAPRSRTSRARRACARRCPTRRRCRSAPTRSRCSTTPAASRMFANGGKAITPHAMLEVRTGTGELIWRFDRDGKKPVQVIAPQVAHRHEHDA